MRRDELLFILLWCRVGSRRTVGRGLAAGTGRRRAGGQVVLLSDGQQSEAQELLKGL